MATIINLGNACPFAVLGGSTVTSTGSTLISGGAHGNVGVSPGSAITGFPPGTINPPGTTHADAVSAAAQTALTIAYNLIVALAFDVDLTGQDLGGQTLTPGVYKFDTSAQLTGTLILDGEGDYIFQIGSTLTTASASSIILINGATANRIFWQVGSSATLGTTTNFKGNILAQASITLNTGVALEGKVLARSGAVTLDANAIIGTQCACPLITVSPLVLPNGMVGTPYNQALVASSTQPAPPFTFSISAGFLPTGLLLGSDGVISGTPTTAGTFNFTVTATDANGCTGDQALNIIVDQPTCPTITLSPGSLPDGVVGTSYNQIITANSAPENPPFTFIVSNGALPNGLILNSAGVLSGTPLTAGIFNFIITTTDNNGCQGSQAYEINIIQPACPIITVNPPVLPNGTIGVSYNETITASSSPSALPFVYTVTSGLLPNGMTLTAGGQLSGIPTTAGTFNFVITATDDNGCQGSRSYSVIIIQPSCPLITLTPPVLPDGVVGTPYNETITPVSTPSASPYTFIISSGILPMGLNIDLNTGVISGNPLTPGTFNFIVTTTDNNGCQGSRNYQIIVTQPDCPIINIIPVGGIIPSGTVGVPFNKQFQATGGTGSYTFSISGINPPPPLEVALTQVPPDKANLSGIPSVAASYDFIITVTDTVSGCQGSQNFILEINEACPIIAITPEILNIAYIGFNYNQILTTTAGASPLVFEVSDGELPPGIELLADGSFIGFPLLPGTFEFEVTVTDDNGCIGIQAFFIIVLTNGARRGSGGRPSSFGISDCCNISCCSIN